MTRDMNFIPNEILLHIFSFLDNRHVLVSSVVCKRWLQLIDSSPTLLNGVCVSFGKNCRKALKLFSSMTRRFTAFKFNKTIIDIYYYQFLKDYGSQFIMLSFIECRIEEESMLILPAEKLNCIHVNTLEIVNCDCWVLFNELPSLKALHVTHENGFCDYYFDQMQKIVPIGIKEFSLNTRIITDTQVYRRFYPEASSLYSRPTDNLLSFPIVIDFVKHHSKTLIALNLTQTDISDQAAMEISQIPSLSLQRVSLASCFRCSRILPSFCLNQRSLVSVDFSGILLLSDEKVKQVVSTLPGLKEINLHHCSTVDSSIEGLFRLRNLESIDLTCCRGIRSTSFQRALSNFESYKLKKLSLCATFIPEDAIAKLISYAVNLRELNLSRCDVTNPNIIAMSRTLLSLQRLSLSQCVKLSDDAFFGHSEGEESVPFSNLKHLIHIDLSHCRLSEEMLCEVIQFKKLTSLDLFGIILSPGGKEKMHEHNPNLKNLKTS